MSTNQNVERNYQEIALIGSGSCGTVYKARDLMNGGHIIALKKVKVAVTQEGVPPTLIREISLLKQLQAFDHPNVVRLLDICHGVRLEKENQLVLYLVFEHVEQDLTTYLENCPSPGLGPDRVKDIMYQLLSGVDFLHSNRIFHRDLKPQNILITKEGRVKLADFGLARIYEQTQMLTSVVVTLWYRAPEVLLQTSYASSVDIWSCGCIFAELYLRRPLFQGRSESDQLSKIFSVIGSPDESEWPQEVSLPCRNFAGFKETPIETLIPEMCPEGCLLLKEMLRFNANRRIAAKDALRHVYFEEFELYPPVYSYYETNNNNNNKQSKVLRNLNNTNNRRDRDCNQVR